MKPNFNNNNNFFGQNLNNNQQISQLKKGIEERDKIIAGYKSDKEKANLKIQNLQAENTPLKNENKNLKKLNENQKTEILKLNSNIQNYQKKISEYEKSIETLQSLLLEKENNQKKEYEKEINNLNQINLKLRNENQQSKNDYKKLNDDFQKLQIENNANIEKITNLNEKIKELKDKIKNNEKEMNEVKKMKENADQSSKYEKAHKEDFYDLIIKCNSILALKNGWEIIMTEKGEKNYSEHKNTKYTKIGVIGSENRGKSTILSDFSRIELPTGVSIKTEGLSIKYPELKEFINRKIILLDSAGLETPILKADNNGTPRPGPQEEYEIKEGDKIENGNEEIKTADKRENVHDLFENKSRDIIQLELFLQNFIIKYSDILILILGKLTINEQKLLLKVNSHIKNLNRKEPLIVIHNLKDFEKISQVHDYLENILKKSSTFSLEENFDINFENKESEWKPLFEPKGDPKIYHLIYAKKGTEAGDYYNQKAIDHIYKLMSSITDKDPFDPIECMKNYFSEISETILENPIGKDDLIYNPDVIADEKDKNVNKRLVSKIMLKEQSKEIILKKCLIDELGIVQGNSFNAQYSYYITDKKVYVYVELPGKFPEKKDDIEYADVKIEPQAEGSYYIIKITGRKKNDYEKIIDCKEASQFNKRQFGEFNIQIKLDKINLSKDYDVEIKNGCVLIKFPIEKTPNKREI